MNLTVHGTEIRVIYPATSIPTEWRGRLLGVDIETAPRIKHRKAGLDPWLTRISLVQIYDGKTKTVHIFDVLESGVEWLRETLENNTFIAHNAKFEITHLRHAGIDLKIPWHCTQLQSQLIGGVYTPQDDPDEDEMDTPVGEKDGLGAYRRTAHTFESCCIRWLSVVPDKSFQTSPWGERPLSSNQIGYAALDAWGVYELFRLFIQKLDKLEMLKIYDLQRKALFPISAMETRGVAFNWMEHERLIERWKTQKEEAEKVTHEFFGNINLASPKQLGEWVRGRYTSEVISRWPTAPKGALSFTASALADFRHLPEIEALFHWKKLNKLLTTYGEKLAREHCHPLTQRIHTGFTLGETATGRLSSKSPNLQNQPRDGSMRGLFIAPKDQQLVVSDFSQIELRIQAELSRDPVMLKAFKEGQDVYKVMASSLYGIDIAAINKEQRTLGKIAMLSLGYGTGAPRLRSKARADYDLEIDMSQAYQTHTSYHQLFHGYSSYCDEVRTIAEDTGGARTLTGKLRKIERDRIYTTAPNHIVQGTATELLLLALNLCWDRGLNLILTVHDEIILESNTALEDCAALTACMNEAWGTLFPESVSKDVADAHFGENWQKAKH